MERKKAGWEKVYETVRQIGRPRTLREIEDRLRLADPEYNVTNAQYDVRKIIMNDLSRGHYQLQAQP